MQHIRRGEAYLQSVMQKHCMIMAIRMVRLDAIWVMPLKNRAAVVFMYPPKHLLLLKYLTEEAANLDIEVTRLRFIPTS